MRTPGAGGRVALSPDSSKSFTRLCFYSTDKCGLQDGVIKAPVRIRTRTSANTSDTPTMGALKVGRHPTYFKALPLWRQVDLVAKGVPPPVW